MRKVNAAVTVTLPLDQHYQEMRPAVITWRGSRLRVARASDRWAETGRWWEEESGQTVWRLELIGGGMVEVATADGKAWRLLVVWD